MDPRRLIAAVRDGHGLSAQAAGDIVRGLTDGSVSDAQAASFAMAVLMRGIGAPGRVALTQAMRDSGTVLSWDLPGPVVDKHSTGGVGDSVSLLLAPALAACGVFVPMISGRGLGHTGGTLDKLESIPGYRTQVDADTLRRVVGQVGCAIVGAGTDLVPADRRLYAIRDEAACVESLDLITASILSKKLAEGLDALVLDVKVGSGAFFADVAQARALAHALVATANGAGCRTSALLTDMSQSLGHSAGNALEVLEVMQTLTCTDVNDALWDVTAALGGEVLHLAGLADGLDAGAELIGGALSSGRAAEAFGRMVAALGGPADFVERYPDRLPACPVMVPVPCPQAGYVARVNARSLGQVVVQLGGGRSRPLDRVNPAVGLSNLAAVGEEMAQGEPLALIHAASVGDAMAAQAIVLTAYDIAPQPPTEPALIHDRIGPGDVQ